MASGPRYWFPAKRYGWGWGWPSTWEGWLAFAAVMGLLAAGCIVVPPQKTLVGFVAYAVGLGAVMVGICWLKGEPPRWRWGERDR